MKSIDPPDSMYLSAAVGWLELGNWREASKELKKISSVLEDHPDVLTVRQQICVDARKWDLAAEIAEALLKLKPDEPQSSIALAYATRRKKEGGIEKAKAILMAAREKFPGEPIIAFNLACYECQLGDLEKARYWLWKASEIGTSNAIKVMALQDKDLEPLWAEISSY